MGCHNKKGGKREWLVYFHVRYADSGLLQEYMGEDYRGSRSEEEARGRAAQATEAGDTEAWHEDVTFPGGLPHKIVLG